MKIEIQPEELEKLIKTLMPTRYSSDFLLCDDALETLSSYLKNRSHQKIQIDSNLSDSIREGFQEPPEQNT